MSRTHHYPSDLSDAEWAILAPLFPPAAARGRPRKWSLRIILDGLFYILHGGCAWRMLPCDFPPWQTVYHYFRCWRLDGTWEYLNTVLRERERIRQGRNAQPSACIIDSQSVKATSIGGIRGYDGAKKLSGRKRHLLVDVLGLVLRATVHAADAQDRAAVPLVLEGVVEQFPHLEHLWADQGYTGAGKEWIEEQLGWTVKMCNIRRRRVASGDRSVTSTIWQASASNGYAYRPRQRDSGGSSRDDGWRSGRSVGSGKAGGWRRSTSGCARRARR